MLPLVYPAGVRRRSTEDTGRGRRSSVRTPRGDDQYYAPPGPVVDTALEDVGSHARRRRRSSLATRPPQALPPHLPPMPSSQNAREDAPGGAIRRRARASSVTGNEDPYPTEWRKPHPVAPPEYQSPADRRRSRASITGYEEDSPAARRRSRASITGPEDPYPADRRGSQVSAAAPEYPSPADRRRSRASVGGTEDLYSADRRRSRAPVAGTEDPHAADRRRSRASSLAGAQDQAYLDVVRDAYEPDDQYFLP